MSPTPYNSLLSSSLLYAQLFSVYVVFVLCMKSGFLASVNSVNSWVIFVFFSDVSCLPFCYVCIMSMCVFLTLCTANCQTTINFLMLYSLPDGRQLKRLVHVNWCVHKQAIKLCSLYTKECCVHEQSYNLIHDGVWNILAKMCPMQYIARYIQDLGLPFSSLRNGMLPNHNFSYGSA